MKSLIYYDHKKIERKWQAKWISERLYSPEILASSGNFYNLWMFPYPSAEGVHVGTIFSSTGSDVYGRYMRMQGKQVFQPMGYDSFGIHSENYALKIGEAPGTFVSRAVNNYERQFKQIGHGYDWTRTVTTSDIDYYKWTQWLFVQMFKAGLAYKKKAAVNWCPSCKTVLADEQIFTPAQAGKWPKQYLKLEDIPEGVRVCERCGSEPERKELEQWFFRITDYADRLLAGLTKIDWSQRVVTAQREWIGRSKGLEIKFKIDNSQFVIPVWTKFWETVFGTTFLVLAPDLSVLENLEIPKSHKKEVSEYIKNSLSKSEQQRKEEVGEKTGVFTGLYAINPVNKRKIPIWIADYVLMGVGTGAVMGVPAHDKRDFDFAKKYHLQIKPVVLPQREYVDKNAKSYYAKRTKIVREILTKLAKLASENGKKLLVFGGWGVSIQVGQEFREFEDLDICILEEDLNWWKDQIKALGLKSSNMFPDPKNNDKYYFQATKQDVHIDVLTIKVDKDQKVTFLSQKEPQELNYSFHEMFEEKEFDEIPIWVLKRDRIYEWKKDHQAEHGVHRWKEQSDFVMMGFEAYEGPGRIINSGQFDDMDAWGEGKQKMAEWMIKEGFASWKTTYHLRDWLISRQRYWGPPIPMIYCETCARDKKSWFDTEEAKQFKKIAGDATNDWSIAGWYPEENLPIKLPKISDYKPEGKGKGPLANHPEFYKTKCPSCGGNATRETDVSDTFVDSSWYFLRYPSVGVESSTSSAFDSDITKKWLPVDLYFGGAEHAVLHLMYARFVTMVLHDLQLIDFEEPFPKFYAHGLMIKDGAKMSKSRGNVVNPDEYIAKFGADTLRLYLMFMGPMDGYPDFRDTGIEGMHRFVMRIWKVFTENDSYTSMTDEENQFLSIKINQTIKKVSEDISNFKYNTAIASIMELINKLKQKKVSQDILKSLCLILAPFTPHMAEEIWVEVLQQKFSVHKAKWPSFNPKLAIVVAQEMIVQVDGKHRGSLKISQPDLKTQNKLETMAMQDPKIAKYLQEKKIINVIFVPGKIINFVTHP